MVDPHEIETTKFKTTRVREGYDQDEVDNFLDQVAVTLRTALDSNSNLNAECGRLRARNDTLQRALDARDDARTIPVPVVVQQTQQDSEAASRLLALAQKTADEVVVHAEAEAQEIVKQATISADHIVGVATADADARRAEAETAAQAAEERLAAIAAARESARSFLDSALAELRDKVGE